MSRAEAFVDAVGRNLARFGAAGLAIVLLGFHSHSGSASERSLEVTATAYNSVERQTSKQPWIAAWGDRLAPGMQVIAVSRDLLKTHGLKRGTVVRIEGLDGSFVVLDKMNKRWRKKIDVYMGSDIRGARKFGRRRVTIRWRPQGSRQSAATASPAAATEQPTSSAVVAETETP